MMFISPPTSLTKLVETKLFRRLIIRDDYFNAPTYPTRVASIADKSEQPWIGMAADWAIQAGLASRYGADLTLGSTSNLAEDIEKGSRSSAKALLMSRSSMTNNVEMSAEELRSILLTCHQTLLDEAEQSTLSSSAVDAAFRLAGFETYARVQNAERVFIKPSADARSELKALFAIVPWDEFRPSSRLKLNPILGGVADAPTLGADGDLLIDDAIIDIKTTKKIRLNPYYYRQLLGYLLLARHGAVEGAPVSRALVYFARAGRLEEVIDIEETLLMDPKIEKYHWDLFCYIANTANPLSADTLEKRLHTQQKTTGFWTLDFNALLSDSDRPKPQPIGDSRTR